MEEVKTYHVGPLTMLNIFRLHGIENVSDWQVVLDAVEEELASYSDKLDKVAEMVQRFKVA